MAVEPPFGALLQTLVSAGVPQSWVGEYARQLRELVAGDPSPDDIWSIVYDLYSLTLPEAEPGAPAAPPAPPRVARSSAFGLFARRARVSFDLAPFEAPHPAGLTLLIPAKIIDKRLARTTKCHPPPPPPPRPRPHAGPLLAHLPHEAVARRRSDDAAAAGGASAH